MQAFVKVFGEYAGWAHNALFITQLASHKHLLDGSTSSPSGSASDTVHLEQASPPTVSQSTPESKKPKKPTGKSSTRPANQRSTEKLDNYDHPSPKKLALPKKLAAQPASEDLAQPTSKRGRKRKLAARPDV